MALRGRRPITAPTGDSVGPHDADTDTGLTQPRGRGIGTGVGSVEPTGRGAHGRVLHRASEAGDEVGWRQTAERTGRPPHPTAESSRPLERSPVGGPGQGWIRQVLSW